MRDEDANSAFSPNTLSTFSSSVSILGIKRLYTGNEASLYWEWSVSILGVKRLYTGSKASLYWEWSVSILWVKRLYTGSKVGGVLMVQFWKIFKKMFVLREMMMLIRKTFTIYSTKAARWCCTGWGWPLDFPCLVSRAAAGPLGALHIVHSCS